MKRPREASAMAMTVEAAARKLTPPAVSPANIARPALEARLDESFGRRLTAVVAGPGFGKSTALAAWVADVEFAWYTVTREDDAPATLARGLAAALARAVGAAFSLPSALRAARGRPGDLEGQGDVLGALLAEGVARGLEHDLVLVLDDVHEVDREAPAVRLLGSLCRQAPSTLHVVLASRSELPFPIERLRGRGEVLELGPSDLAFDLREVARLLAGALGETGVDLARPVYDATGGWPAAVRLALEALQPLSLGERTKAVEVLRKPHGPLFSYLAEEVIGREAEQLRELIRSVAPFERVDEELCEALGIDSAAGKLDSLTRRGLLLLQPDGDRPGFSLHTLVRDFARDRLPLTEGRRCQLERRACRLFEQRGELGAALRSAVAAGETSAALRLLAEHGAELLSSGEVDAIESAAQALPAALRSHAAEQTIGHAHALSGDWEAALGCYQRAAGEAFELSPGLAWRMGRIHFDRGDLEQALETYSRGRLDGSDPSNEALLLAWSASAHWSRGDIETCTGLADRALELAKTAEEPLALGVAHNVLMLAALGGDPAAGDVHFRDGLAAAEKAGDPQLVVRLRANRAAQLQQEGEYGEALEVLEPAIEIAEIAGAGLALAFPLLKRGELQLCLGRLDQALADVQAAMAIYRRFGSKRVLGALTDLGEVHRERGDLALARAALEEAVEGGKSSGDAQVLVYARSGLARVIGLVDPPQGRRLAEEAVATGRRFGFGLETALIGAGWVALAAGDREEAGRCALEAAEEARKRRDRPALAESMFLGVLSGSEPAAGADRIDEAIEIWQQVGNPIGEAVAQLARARLAPSVSSWALAARATRKLEATGVRVSAAAGAAGPLAFLPPERPPAVAIRALGSFAVLRDGDQVRVAEWRGKKARELLKVLVSRRHRPIARELLMEMLWPGTEPPRLANRFSVALSTLRSVLDPDSRFDSDHFVVGDRDAVSLRGEHIVTDVETFLDEAEVGLSLLRQGKTVDATERLEGAETAYAGDFLEEDGYADWAVALREEARSVYIAVARALAAQRSASGAHAEASRYLLRILERDPHDERAHLELVSSLEAAGGHGEARRAYRRYAASMEEIGVEPAPYPASGASTAADQTPT
jgi:ATP/maltotriose-dependent transcriptional regulator MalT/DNA-binding SARP family transcriptional activator